MAKGLAALASTAGRPGKKKKNVPVFSHEFIQDNHADIVSVICMIMVFGLMLEMTRAMFSPFVTPQHLVNGTDVNGSNGTNGTLDDDDDMYMEEEEDVIAGPGGSMKPARTRRIPLFFYRAGPLDICTLFFYTMVWVIMHAVFKEFVWDRFVRQLHLSKAKTFVYFEACNILFYNIFGFIFACIVLLQEGYLKDISMLWKDYPHTNMTFRIKLFMIIQMAYWLHNIPEMYFLKVKQEDVPARLQFYILNLLPLVAVYILHFQRVGLVFFALHSLGEIFRHLHSLLGLWRESAAQSLTTIWTFFFILVRLTSVAVATLVFIVGLPKENDVNSSQGGFNVLTVRMALFASVLLLQLWLVWQFTNFHLAILRDRQERQRIRSKLDTPSERRQKQKEKKEMAVGGDGEVRARQTGSPKGEKTRK